MVKLVSANEDFVSAMTLLGEEDEPSVAVKETLEKLVCSLYQVKDVKEAKDVLIERANYQCQL